MNLRMHLLTGAVAFGLVPGFATAQLRYQEPPTPLPALLDTELLPSVAVSPDGSRLLIKQLAGLEPIERVAGPWVPLAGHRINPRTNGPHSSYATFQNTYSALKVRSVLEASEHSVRLPATDRIRDVLWSPDSKLIAFTVTTDDRITLWLAEAATGTARQLTPTALNAAARGGGRRPAGPCAWMPDSRGLICRFVPEDRGAPPPEPMSPVGPLIQEADGSKAPVWTFQDLLASPHDEALFDYYFTDQLAIVALDGTMTRVGPQGIHTEAEPSPDGRYLLVNTVHRPYSYRIGIDGFPTRIELWDRAGRVVRQIVDRPVQELGSVPGRDVVVEGPRNAAWRGGAPATLIWAEALDGGDPKKPADQRDRVVQLAAPFSEPPAPLIDLEYRFTGLVTARPNLAFLTEHWWSTRRLRMWTLDPSNPDRPPRKVDDRSSQDRYHDPGDLVTVGDGTGGEVVLLTADGRAAYRAGEGASDQGDRPFLDRIDVATGRTERLWRAEAPYYERVEAVLDPSARRVLTRRESVQDPPNYFVRDLRRNTQVQLTRFADPAPEFAAITPQLITYRREDGIQLSAKLFLPKGYHISQGPLPFVLWAYPDEFKDPKAASQVVGSPYRFTRPGRPIGDHLLLLTQGYGVLDGPTMPIIGAGAEQPNDTYVEQLVANAKAAIDKIVAMGVADRGRVAVGGHSYGGFMTGNLLAHSDLFRAGIARSAAYNRTLTPFGFQSEPRTFWEAKDIYMRMSPFAYADQIKGALLMIHGASDPNVGSYPVQSKRMFDALRANGGLGRLVFLPAEGHVYLARESMGHALWEMVRWLDLHVKPARPRAR